MYRRVAAQSAIGSNRKTRVLRGRGANGDGSGERGSLYERITGAFMATITWPRIPMAI